MDAVLDLLFLSIIGYFIFRFVQLLIKMKQDPIFPLTKEELATIKIYPQKPVEAPVYSKQKVGIIIYSCTLLFVIGLLTAAYFSGRLEWTFYLLILLPLTHSGDLFNLFAIVKDGILAGGRFISWKSVKSFQIHTIDVNHKYYGYSMDVNSGYELRVKAKGRTISCIVTSDEVKEKLVHILSEHVDVRNSE